MQISHLPHILTPNLNLPPPTSCVTPPIMKRTTRYWISSWRMLQSQDHPPLPQCDLVNVYSTKLVSRVSTERWSCVNPSNTVQCWYYALCIYVYMCNCTCIYGSIFDFCVVGKKIILRRWKKKIFASLEKNNFAS